jgi:hypothetical protein
MHSSLCFSLATNLRCAGLTRSQATAILVLPGVEVVLGLMLAKAQWGGDKYVSILFYTGARTILTVFHRNRWLLIFEGLVFFLLSLADFLLHENARVNPDITQFEIYDKAIGKFSFQWQEVCD